MELISLIVGVLIVLQTLIMYPTLDPSSQREIIMLSTIVIGGIIWSIYHSQLDVTTNIAFLWPIGVLIFNIIALVQDSDELITPEVHILLSACVTAFATRKKKPTFVYALVSCLLLATTPVTSERTADVAFLVAVKHLAYVFATGFIIDGVLNDVTPMMSEKA